MRNALLLPVMLCVTGNGWASGVFNMSPDWSCNLPGSQSNLRLSAVLLDEDNYPDLVIGNTASDHLLVYLGNGDGSFSLNQEYPLSNPIWIETADIDDDLDEDVIVRFRVSSGIDSIAVFHNQQDGSLTEPICSPGGFGVSSADVSSFRVLDFTDDGNLDLLVPHSSGIIELLVGTGSGFFQSDTLISGLPGAKSLDAFDVDSDGDTDVVVLTYGSVTVLLNDGTGSVTNSGEYGSLPTDVDIGTLESVDLNLDTYPDIVTAPGAAIGSLSIFSLLGDGNGGFTQVEPGWHSLGNSFCHTTTDDLNLDGHPDAFFNGYCGHLLLLGDGQGALIEDYYYHLAVWCWEAAVADFDLDGDLDYATATRPFSQLNLEVFLNKTISSGIEEGLESPPTYVIGLQESIVSGLTSVIVELPECCFCSVAAYDMNGREVQHLHSGSLPQGPSEITWDTSQLPSGCYFLRLVVGTRESANTRCVVVD